MITLSSDGACEEVTGSNHFLEWDGKQIMLDYGLFQGHRKDSEEKNKREADLDHLVGVILSHVHIDHSGRMPKLAKRYSGKIYTTPASKDLAYPMLMDSARIQENDASYLNWKFAKELLNRNMRKKNRDHWLKKIGRPGKYGLDAIAKVILDAKKYLIKPLYLQEDVELLYSKNMFFEVPYHEEFMISDDAKGIFYDAGHVLGSAITKLDIRGTKIVFTGDLGREGSAIINGPEKNIGAVDALIIESTYGGRYHKPSEELEPVLEEAVEKAYRRGGDIIIPAFSLERSQDMIYHLHNLKRRGKLPNIPIYLDSPLSVRLTEVFRRHPECFNEQAVNEFIKNGIQPFVMDELHLIEHTQDSIALNKDRSQKIIIASSGMCEAGRIRHHLKNHVLDNRNTIFIVGYTARNTLAQKIADHNEKIRIFGKEYSLRANVENLDPYWSAHADENELVDWVHKSKMNPKQIFLVHGEGNALTSLEARFHKEGFVNVQVVKEGERYNI